MPKRFSNFNVLLKLIIIAKIERYRTLMDLLLLNEKTGYHRTGSITGIALAEREIL